MKTLILNLLLLFSTALFAQQNSNVYDLVTLMEIPAGDATNEVEVHYSDVPPYTIGPSALLYTDDSVVLYDFWKGRVAVFSHQSAFLEEFPISMDPWDLSMSPNRIFRVS